MEEKKKLPPKKAKKNATPLGFTKDEERELDFLTRYKDRKKPPRTVVSQKDGITQVRNHPDDNKTLYSAGLTECFGTFNTEVIDILLMQLTDFTGKGFTESETTDKVINTALAMMHDIKPQDTIEAMLAVQMIATHTVSLSCLKQLYKRGGLTLEQMNSYLNLGTKLSRTYVAQMEALNRHRGKGQQKMTVEHVHVHEGGQAIVGNVHKGGEK